MERLIALIFLTIVIIPGLNIIMERISQTSSAQMTITNLTDVSDTFSATGTISSLNFYSNNISNIGASKKVILSGDWSMNVNNGSVSFFEADFVAAPSDGTVSHTHELVNLMVKDAKPVQIASNGNASIVGTIDIKLNGINYWNDVKISILISKGSTITISLDDTETQHHFTKQPIYGIVHRLMY